MELCDIGKEEWRKSNQKAEDGGPVSTILMIMYLMLLINDDYVNNAINIW